MQEASADPTGRSSPAFDEYRLTVRTPCPQCGADIIAGQGSDGPNMLLIFQQGQAAAVGHLGSSSRRNGWQQMPLPSDFKIDAWCSASHYTTLICRAVDGIWTGAEPVNRQQQ